MLVHVVHPVLYSYRPRRARTVRHDFGTGVTPVELREVSERPREALRTGATRVLAAEGTAWTVLTQGRANVTPGEFAHFLSEASPDWSHGMDAKAKWAACSPLYFHWDHGRARTGGLDPTGAEDVGGAEQAAADVRAFLDDRVRLHGDRVLVREERLVGLSDFYNSAPSAVMGDWSRGEGTMRHRYPSLLAIRPDRLDRIWAMHERPRKGPVPTGDWDRIAGIPDGLRRDDDVAWIANRLPKVFLGFARDVARRGAEDADEAALLSLAPALEALDRRSWTHAVAGDGIGPALETIRAAAASAVRIIEADPAAHGRGVEATSLAVRRLILRALDDEYLPRHASPDREHDEGSLAGLAPR